MNSMRLTSLLVGSVILSITGSLNAEKLNQRNTANAQTELPKNYEEEKFYIGVPSGTALWANYGVEGETESSLAEITVITTTGVFTARLIKFEDKCSIDCGGVFAEKGKEPPQTCHVEATHSIPKAITKLENPVLIFPGKRNVGPLIPIESTHSIHPLELVKEWSLLPPQTGFSLAYHLGYLGGVEFIKGSWLQKAGDVGFIFNDSYGMRISTSALQNSCKAYAAGEFKTLSCANSSNGYYGLGSWLYHGKQFITAVTCDDCGAPLLRTKFSFVLDGIKHYVVEDIENYQLWIFKAPSFSLLHVQKDYEPMCH